MIWVDFNQSARPILFRITETESKLNRNDENRLKPKVSCKFTKQRRASFIQLGATLPV